MARSLRCHASIQICIRAFLVAELEERIPRHHPDNAAVAALEVPGGRHAPDDDGLQDRELVDLGGCTIVLDLRVHYNDLGARVRDLVSELVGRVSGIDANVLATAEHGAEGADHPLRSVESEDADGAKLLHAQLHEGLGGATGILVILRPSPLLPLRPGQRRCVARPQGCRHGLLRGQRQFLREVLRGLRQERGEVPRRAGLRREHALLRASDGVLVVRQAAVVLARLVGRDLVGIRLGSDEVGGQHMPRENTQTLLSSGHADGLLGEEPRSKGASASRCLS
mmetsp:Transcript_159993/g.509469  ORF Transcript_159993/g.509469 Transcript_159993/m.509469 type:complete len:282 (+) Transcript_159993:1574-2419(+)